MKILVFSQVQAVVSASRNVTQSLFLLVMMLFSSMVSAQQFTAYPDNDPNSGRFVNIVRGLSSLGDVSIGDISLSLRLEVSATSTQPLRVEIFDGDSGGRWDTPPFQNNDEVAYEIFADPDRVGNTDPLSLVGTSVSSLTLPDNDWGLIYNGPNVGPALTPDGTTYSYHITAKWVNPTIGNELNNFKVRTNARVILPVGVTQGLIGHNAAEYDFLQQFGVNTGFAADERNTFDGTYTFKTIVREPDNPSETVCSLDLYDGDLDFAGDTDDPNSIDLVGDNSDNYPPFNVSTATLAEGVNPGAPADDPAAAQPITISPSVFMEIYYDGGLIKNLDVSGSAEWELFRILSNDPYCITNNLPADRSTVDGDVTLPSIDPGEYFFVVRGADGRNTIFFTPLFELEPAELPAASIGNYVWVDENGDGYQDAGEPGLGNVAVELTDFAGNTITTTTGTDGGYLFTDLFPGQYTVTIDATTLPVGLTQSTNPVLPSADLGNQSLPYVIDLGLGEKNLTADFGYQYGDPTGNTGNGAIGDYVWIDTNGDGVQDAGESGLGGITVEIYADTNGDGVVITDSADPAVDGLFVSAVDQNGDTGTGSTITEADGSYVFTGLSADIYKVVVLNPPAGYLQTGDPDDFGTLATAPDNQTTIEVVIAPGDAYLNIDFGYQPDTVVTNSIGDFVYFDINKDGLQTAGQDFGIAGVTMSLLDTNGVSIASTTTDETGFYLFDGLPDGDYTVVVTDTDAILSQLDQTADPDALFDERSTTTVTGGISDLDQDFGYTDSSTNSGLLGSVGDTVFLDRNNDGMFDSGEGIEGVAVEISTTGGVLLNRSITNASGFYIFSGLMPDGAYTVRVIESTLPSNDLTNTVDPDGGDASQSTVSLASDPDGVNDGINLDQDFGYSANTPGTIGDLVWLDTNADGFNDGLAGPDGIVGTEDDEPGIEGVTLAVYFDSDGNGLLETGEPRVGTTTTDSNGVYLFEGLPDGDYIVDVTDEAGLLNGYWRSLGNVDTNDNSQTDPYAVNLPAGGAVDTADFGYYVELASIGNFVWFDSNADGQQSADELGIDNVTVTLTIDYPDSSTVVMTQQTGAAGMGLYVFDNLLADENYNGDSSDGSQEPIFTITVEDPAGLTASPADVGNDEAIDSDNPAGELGETIPGGFDDTNDFGYYDLGSISGNVGEDTDRDGTVDVLLNNVTINLYQDSDQDGIPDDLNTDGLIDANDIVATTTTGGALGDGNYEFTDIDPGHYLVQEIDPTGYDSILDLDSTVDVPSDPNELGNASPTDNLLPVSLVVDTTARTTEEDTGNDFVDSPMLASIGDTVWFDHNANGIQEAGEAGVASVTVNLQDDTGAVIDTTVTDSTGFYEFDGLIAGTYTVVVDSSTLPGALQKTYDFDDGATTSPATPDQATVTIAAGEEQDQIDFGYRPLASIGDTVWFDLNANGVQDTGEAGIANVDVTLSGSVNASQTTGANGQYQFDNLPAGNYTVTVSGAALANLQQTHDLDDPVTTSPSTPDTAQVVLAINASNLIDDNLDVDFGYRQLGSISGSVQEDTDGNGTGDQPISTDVQLYEDTDGDGILDTGEPLVTTVSTDASGNYLFQDVDPGNYIVVEVQPVDLVDVSDEDEDTTHAGDPDPQDSNTAVDNEIGVQLNSGESDTGNSFVDENQGSISGSVLEDTDGDGVGDEPQTSVTVTLYEDTDGDGVLDTGEPEVTTTTTDANGDYLFEDLSPGDYVVIPDQDPDLTDVLDQDQATDGDDPQDNDTTVDNSVGVGLEPGESDTENNFVDVNTSGSISGTVTQDTTGDGNGDTSIQGVMLELFEADTLGNPVGSVITTATTGADGSYTFSGLQPGNYVVVEDQPADLVSISDQDQAPDGDSYDTDTTVDNRVAATVEPGESDTANNFVEQALASIEGQVLIDNNGDGVGDVGLGGVDITLQDSNGNSVGSTTTAADGSYSFTGLQPGNYTVVETQPAGLDSVLDQDQTPDGDPQDADTTVDDTVGVNLTPGETDTGNNFIESAFEPMIDIRKQQEGPDSRTFNLGDTVEFEIAVTNTGNVDLTNVVVNDPLVPACDNTIGSLAAGQTVTYTCQYTLQAGSTLETTVFADNFESNLGWALNADGDDTATTGLWQAADPEPTTYNGYNMQLHSGYNGSAGNYNGLFTGPLAGSSVGAHDIDGGKTSIKSPAISIPTEGQTELSLQYYLAHASNANANDFLKIQIYDQSGGKHTLLDKRGKNSYLGANWTELTADLSNFAGQTVNLVVKASDATDKGGLIEAAVDEVKITNTTATEPDTGFVNIADVSGEANGQVVTDSDPSEVIVSDICIPKPSDSVTNGQSYSIWIAGEYFSASANNTYTVDDAAGTARYQGSVTSNSNGATHNVDILFSGRTTTAPAGSPKLPPFSVDTSDWVYYTDISGNVGPYTVSRRGPAYQVGYGANMNDSGYGASGWMYFTDGSTTLNGDINIQLVDCEEPPICEECVNGYSEITLQISNWSSNRDQSEIVRVREGGLGGALLFEGQVANGGLFSFNVNNPGTTIVVTVQGTYHPSEYVKGTFVTDCDLYVNKTSGNSYITFKVADLVGDGNGEDCPEPPVCEICVNGYSQITLKISNWSSSRDTSERIRVREGGLGGAVLYDSNNDGNPNPSIPNGGTFTFNVPNPGSTIVVTVQGANHYYETVKGTFVTDCDLYVNETSGNSYITFKVTELVGDGENGDCPDPVDPTPPPSNGTTTIKNAYAGKCLDNNGATSNGTKIYKNSCDGSNDQQWQLQVSGGYYKVINQTSGKCLDGYSNYSGSIVDQYSCNGTSTQLWQMVSVGSSYQFKSKTSGLCMQVQGTSSAKVYSCSTSVSSGQLWNVTLP